MLFVMTMKLNIHRLSRKPSILCIMNKYSTRIKKERYKQN